MNGSEQHLGAPPDRYSFANFTLDPVGGHLYREGEPIELRPKSFEVLVYLVQRHGRVATREELMQALWPDVAVTDESVTRCIADIRKVLGDESQHLIRTVPRRGYLFAAPVTTPVLVFPRGQELQREQTLSQISAAPQRSNLAGVCLAVMGAVLLAFVGWTVSRAPKPVQPIRATPLVTLPGLVRYPSFSPDGEYVAFTWTGPNQDNPDVYVQQIGSGAPLRLTTDPKSDYNPVWSPNGRWIAFLRRHTEDPATNDLLLIPPLGGLERKIGEIRLPNTYFVLPPYVSWCPDSSCMVITDATGKGQSAALFLFSVDTAEKKQLTRPEDFLATDTNPALSRDATRLVFRRQTAGSQLGELYSLQLGKGLAPVGAPQRLTRPVLDAGYPTWKSDSTGIVFSTEASEIKGSLWTLTLSERNIGEAVRLPFVGEDGIMPGISRPNPGRPSRLAYVRTFQDSNIWRVEAPAAGAAASSRPALAIASTRRDSTPQLSPDGRRIAFASDRSGQWEIWVSDLNGSNAVQLTSIGLAGAPTWSPDGTGIAFQAALEGQSDVYIIASAGGKPRNLTSHPAQDTRPSFSHDGKWIYFTSNRSGMRQIWKMPVSGGDAIQLTQNGAFAVFESPDGSYVYYNQTMDTPSALWRVPVSGGTPSKVLDGVVRGAFAVLERGIYFIDRPSGNAGVLSMDRPSGETRLQYFDFATGKSNTVAHQLGDVFLGLTASKDGHTIFYSRVDSSLDDLMLVENFR